jgi:hypothetical protein
MDNAGLMGITRVDCSVCLSSERGMGRGLGHMMDKMNPDAARVIDMSILVLGYGPVSCQE